MFDEYSSMLWLRKFISKVTIRYSNTTTWKNENSFILWIVQQWSQPSNSFGNEFNYFGKMKTKLHPLNRTVVVSAIEQFWQWVQLFWENENEVAFFELYSSGLSLLTILVMSSTILGKWTQSYTVWIVQQWSKPSDSFGNEHDYFGKMKTKLHSLNRTAVVSAF